MHLKIFLTTGYCISGANYYLCVALSFNSLVFFLFAIKTTGSISTKLRQICTCQTVHQSYKLPEVSSLAATHALFEAGGH